MRVSFARILSVSSNHLHREKNDIFRVFLFFFHVIINRMEVESVATSQLQSSWFVPELGLLSMWSFSCSLHDCIHFLQVLWFPTLGGELAMLNCLRSVYGALQWTGVTSRVYSHLLHIQCSHPDKGSTMTITTLTRIKEILKMNEWMNKHL